VAVKNPPSATEPIGGAPATSAPTGGAAPSAKAKAPAAATGSARGAATPSAKTPSPASAKTPPPAPSARTPPPSPSKLTGQGIAPSPSALRAAKAKAAEAKPITFSATPSLYDTTAPVAPERYGKYHLLERIGVGGMAEVWRAKTLGSEGFTKDLVIKRILPKFTNDEESVRMFIDEARLVAKLHHPNIVQIFDFDKEGDRYYLAMELIEGRDLRQAEKSSAKAGVWFPISLSIYLIAEALKGLHYAHTRLDHGKPLEIVHRDVSPHNILISFSGDVKISDFGIAKVAERASAQSTGTVKGKLAYMSPEQITGQPLDGRTDIYSMGIVFWELLTRHRLFFGPDEHDVIRRVRDGIVPPPRQFNPEIPEEIEKIVMKMLVANRSQRYQSAGEVVRALCSLPQYNYDAQALGEYMRALFPEETRNWTQMLQTLLATPNKTAPRAEQSVSMQIVVPTNAENAKAATPAQSGAPPAALPTAELSALTEVAEPAGPSPVKTLAMVSSGPPPAPAKGSDPTKPQSAPSPPPTSGRPPPPPQPTRHLTQPASSESAPTTSSSAPGSTMAGSEQKTQIATEMPPEVASALATQASPGGASAPPAATPPAAGPPPAAAGAAAGARTMIASAPALPSSPPPPASPPVADGAGARTMLATAPAVPALGGGQATLIAGPGGAPPGAGGGTPLNAAATMYNSNSNSGPTSSPGGRSSPLPLRPASAVFGAAPASTHVLVTGKWVIGPALALVVMLITAAIANRIWPPATGSGGGGPSFLAAKRAIQITSDPPGAEVQVDGVVLDEKTPTQVKGEIGKSARIRISLPGYDAHEVTLAFTQDARPPYKVKLFKAGTRQKTLDPSVFDEKPDVSKNDEDGDDKKPSGDKGKDDGKKPTADKDDKKDDKTDKKDDKTDKKGDKKKDEPEEEDDSKKKGKKGKEGDAAKKAKATLTVLVRPWAIVYLDGKKLQQTPLRNYPISAGAHKILLVNDTKGKREEIKLKVTAGEAVPEIKRTWE